MLFLQAKLLGDNTKKLVKAGLLTDTLDLSVKGARFLLSILLLNEDTMAEMVKQAERLIKEEKGTK